jgi:hypothetical protein
VPDKPTNGPLRDITQLRARVDAGDRDAAGPLGELLAAQGDRPGAIQVWAAAYGDEAPWTKQLADLLVREGYPEDTVSVWEASAAVWSNPISLYRQHLATLSDEERREHEYDEPEEMAGTWTAVLTELLAHHSEEAVIAQLRAREARPGNSAAAPPQ